MTRLLTLALLLTATVGVGCSNDRPPKPVTCDCDLNGDGMCGGPDFTRWSVAWDRAQDNGGFCAPGTTEN